MKESNIHRIPIAPAEAVPPARAAKLRTAAVGVFVGAVLVAGAAWLMRSAVEQTIDVQDPKEAVAATSPPPAGLSAERALALAEARLRDGERSGASLADAWRFAGWAAALGAAAPQTEALQRRIDEQLETRWRRGRFAYVHARKLRRSVAADAALRTLRETFPREHAKSRDLDRLERRP